MVQVLLCDEQEEEHSKKRGSMYKGPMASVTAAQRGGVVQGGWGGQPKPNDAHGLEALIKEKPVLYVSPIPGT